MIAHNLIKMLFLGIHLLKVISTAVMMSFRDGKFLLCIARRPVASEVVLLDSIWVSSNVNGVKV
jgi:hypothetical protein